MDETQATSGKTKRKVSDGKETRYKKIKTEPEEESVDLNSLTREHNRVKRELNETLTPEDKQCLTAIQNDITTQIFGKTDFWSVKKETALRRVSAIEENIYKFIQTMPEGTLMHIFDTLSPYEETLGNANQSSRSIPKDPFTLLSFFYIFHCLNKYVQKHNSPGISMTMMTGRNIWLCSQIQIADIDRHGGYVRDEFQGLLGTKEKQTRKNLQQTIDDAEDIIKSQCGIFTIIDPTPPDPEVLGLDDNAMQASGMAIDDGAGQRMLIDNPQAVGMTTSKQRKAGKARGRGRGAVTVQDDPLGGGGGGAIMAHLDPRGAGMAIDGQDLSDVLNEEDWKDLLEIQDWIFRQLSIIGNTSLHRIMDADFESILISGRAEENMINKAEKLKAKIPGQTWDNLMLQCLPESGHNNNDGSYMQSLIVIPYMRIFLIGLTTDAEEDAALRKNREFIQLFFQTIQSFGDAGDFVAVWKRYKEWKGETLLYQIYARQSGPQGSSSMMVIQDGSRKERTKKTRGINNTSGNGDDGMQIDEDDGIQPAIIRKRPGTEDLKAMLKSIVTDNDNIDIISSLQRTVLTYLADNNFEGERQYNLSINFFQEMITRLYARMQSFATEKGVSFDSIPTWTTTYPGFLEGLHELIVDNADDDLLTLDKILIQALYIVLGKIDLRGEAIKEYFQEFLKMNKIITDKERTALDSRSFIDDDEFGFFYYKRFS